MATGFKPIGKTETSFTPSVDTFDITSKFQEYFTQVTVPISQLPALHEQDDWVGLKTVVMVVRSIQHWNKTTLEVQFYISSLTNDANKIGSAIRHHWGIENSVHWTRLCHFS